LRPRRWNLGKGMQCKAAHQVPCALGWPVIGKDALFGRAEEFQNLFVKVQSPHESHGGRFGKEFRGGHRLYPSDTS
jgi:hypothetical protein